MARSQGPWNSSALASNLSNRKSKIQETSTPSPLGSSEYPSTPNLLTYPRSITSQLPRLKSQLTELTSQFDASSQTLTSPTLKTPNNPSLAPDFAAAQKKPRQVSKSVRFTDNPSSSDSSAAEAANRAALFPYRDDPSSDPDAAPNQDHLDNQQIHEYHRQTIQDQDDQLDQLGASIGRQRELSMQIGDELDGQVMLLDDVEEGVDRHTAQFQRARGRLDRFSRKAKENWSLTVIVVLIIILVLLIVITK
ncbi:hypothetical protein IQ07DRAFT_587145 [Pyrenochaeta sp. DS3sAY3a]|nr:hypothetical protein IQ07DRAFT_587145 [Pyrenochaeta sp. DS3sAY3a]